MTDYFSFIIPKVFCKDKTDALEHAVIDFYSYKENKGNQIYDIDIKTQYGFYIITITFIDRGGNIMINYDYIIKNNEESRLRPYQIMAPKIFLVSPYLPITDELIRMMRELRKHDYLVFTRYSDIYKELALHDNVEVVLL